MEVINRDEIIMEDGRTKVILTLKDQWGRVFIKSYPVTKPKRITIRVVKGAVAAMLLVVTLTTFTGCASYEWRRVHNDTDEAFQTDSHQCRYEIELGYQQYQTGPTRGTVGAVGAGMAAGFGDSVRKAGLMSMCLENKGWRKELKEKKIQPVGTTWKPSDECSGCFVNNKGEVWRRKQ